MTKPNIQFLQASIGEGRPCYRWRKGATEVAASFLCGLAALISAPQTRAQAVAGDINVKLRPVLEHVDVVTDINVVGKTLFVCTQPGQLYRKPLSTSGTAEVFLDLRSEVGRLGSHVPGLPGLGYPTPQTYDERGLLSFAADPQFQSNGRFWVWYSNTKERSKNPPEFFQWLVSTSEPWDTAEYDHVDHLAEYRVVGGVPKFQRTLLKLKRPYFNHTGFQSLSWSPELKTLVLGTGDGGSEYDPNNIAQDDNQLSGKLLEIDLDKLNGRDFTATPPVATFADLRRQQVPQGTFTALVKGLRNPSKVHHEQVDNGGQTNARWIKYLANTGQDTIEFIHGFDNYGLNFGFRPWEGIFPTSFEDGNDRVIAYGLEASRLPNFYHPMVEYTHLDEKLGANANTGSALYMGQNIPGLKGQLVFTDWISFVTTPPHGLLMHAPVNRNDLQEVHRIRLFNVDLSAANLQGNDVLFYTSINTDPDGQRIFVGGFKNLQFIIAQREHPMTFGAVYEVVPQ